MIALVEIGDQCVFCRRDTSFGSGLFVNRIPADDGEFVGYLCPECQCVECDRCGEMTLEYHTVGEPEPYHVCEECLLPGEGDA
jgi:hypothetical protein